MEEKPKQPPEKVEFQMRNEDFPALPSTSSFGSEQNKIMIPTGSSSLQMGNPSVGFASELEPNILAGNPSIGFVPEPGPNFSASLQPEARINIQTYPDGTMTNIPPTMLTDQFGMAGLLAAYRGMYLEPNIAPLVFGEKAELMGLGMNSESEIHLNYGGPWADKPNHAPHTDVKIPEKYKTNELIREKLAKIKFPLLEEDALFYLFYNYPGEEYQIAAAHELHVRDWRYHKVERVWLRRLTFGSVIEHTALFERGTYNVFDSEHWRKVPREMTVEYKDLEKQPELPPNMKVFFEP
uniref:NOT2_3_5 domain-containing protein n=1 Tax=Onchocerca volvulus TaxID=6282 RepID=A0A8R1XLE3_ONCVO